MESNVSKIYVGIQGLALKRPLILGKAVFRPATSELRRSLLSLIKQHAPDAIQFGSRTVDELLKYGACAVLPVDSVPDQKTSSRLLEPYLDILRYAIPVVAGRSSKEEIYQTQVGIQGQLTFASTGIVQITDEGVGFGFTYDGPMFPLKIEGKGRQRLRMAKAYALAELIEKRDRTKLETALLDAVHWISVGVGQRDANNQFLCFVFAIETLIGMGPEAASLYNDMAETSGFLLAREASDRTAIWKRLRKVFKARNQLVHGRSSSPVQLADIRYTEGVAIQLCVFLIGRISEWSEKSEIREYVTTLRFS